MVLYRAHNIKLHNGPHRAGRMTFNKKRAIYIIELMNSTLENKFRVIRKGLEIQKVFKLASSMDRRLTLGLVCTISVVELDLMLFYCSILS